jgi:hypothetical protein
MRSRLANETTSTKTKSLVTRLKDRREGVEKRKKIRLLNNASYVAIMKLRVGAVL